jgi:hypothetical protein
MNDELWKNVENSGRWPFKDTIAAFVWLDWREQEILSESGRPLDREFNPGLPENRWLRIKWTDLCHKDSEIRYTSLGIPTTAEHEQLFGC